MTRRTVALLSLLYVPGITLAGAEVGARLAIHGEASGGALLGALIALVASLLSVAIAVTEAPCSH